MLVRLVYFFVNPFFFLGVAKQSLSPKKRSCGRHSEMKATKSVCENCLKDRDRLRGISKKERTT